MITAVFRIAVLATVVTRTTSSTITPTIDMVTVRLGEAMHLSCGITLTPIESVSEVRWYRNSSFIPYGSIDVTRCPVASACPEGSTTDDRGTVRYEIGTSNEAVLTLTIKSSTLQDNTSFSCGIVKVGGSSQSSGISVTVYVPEATSPIPGHQTTQAETTESTTNTPDTTTGDRSISSHQTSTTPTTSPGTTSKAILSSRDTASTTRQTTSGPVRTTTPITTATSGQTPSVVKAVSTSAPRATSPPVNTAIIAVAVSACVVIVVLLVIIACLVSWRNSRPSHTKPTLLSLIVPDTDNQEETTFGRAQDTDTEHIYQATLRRTRPQEDVQSSTSQQSPPVYATRSIGREAQTTCNDAPQYATPTRSRRRQPDQYGDPEGNAVEPGPEKAGYSSSERPADHPPEYSTLDPHSRPSSAVGYATTAGRHDQTEEATRDEGACEARPNAEIPQPPEYAESNSEPQTEEITSSEYTTPKPVTGPAAGAGRENQCAGFPEHLSPEYATLESDAGVADDESGNGQQEAGINPEHLSPEYATLEPDAGFVDDESGNGHQETGHPEHLSPEYAVVHRDTAASDGGDEEELLTDPVYAEPFQTK